MARIELAAMIPDSLLSRARKVIGDQDAAETFVESLREDYTPAVLYAFLLKIESRSNPLLARVSPASSADAICDTILTVLAGDKAQKIIPTLTVEEHINLRKIRVKHWKVELQRATARGGSPDAALSVFIKVNDDHLLTGEDIYLIAEELPASVVDPIKLKDAYARSGGSRASVINALMQQWKGNYIKDTNEDYSNLLRMRGAGLRKKG